MPSRPGWECTRKSVKILPYALLCSLRSRCEKMIAMSNRLMSTKTYSRFEGCTAESAIVVMVLIRLNVHDDDSKCGQKNEEILKININATNSNDVSRFNKK